MLITHIIIVVFGSKSWFSTNKTPLTHVTQAMNRWSLSVQVFHEALYYFKTLLHVCNHSLNYFKAEMHMTQWDDELLQKENRLLTRWWWTATKYIHHGKIYVLYWIIVWFSRFKNLSNGLIKMSFRSRRAYAIRPYSFLRWSGYYGWWNLAQSSYLILVLPRINRKYVGAYRIRPKWAKKHLSWIIRE